MGFVLILVIVAVIILVLLGISLRKPAGDEVKSSDEIESFLSSVLGYTSSCTLGSENYQEIDDLILACNVGRLCFTGENSCDVLKQDLKGMMQESWKTGEERPLKGYLLEVDLTSLGPLKIQEGNITKHYGEAHRSLAEGQKVFVNLYF